MSYGNYPDLSGVKRILVIKFRQLGDVLLTTPLLEALHEAMPGAEIDFALYQDAAPLIEHHPFVRRVLGVKRGEKGLRFFWEVIKGRYDLVVNLTEGDRGAIAARLSRAPIRVGFSRKRDSWFYTHVVKSCPTPRHTVERQLDAARRIGIVPKPYPVRLAIPEETRRRVAERVGTRKPIVVHPMSRWRFKCWPHMAELTRALQERGDRVILTGAPQEREEVGRCAGENWAGELSLLEMGALLEMAQLLVTVDSLPLHMASAVKCPTIALFGPSSDVTWGPWQNRDATVLSRPFSCRPCLQDGCGGSKRSECLWALSVAEVLAAVLLKCGNLRPSSDVVPLGGR